jgi:hypothetical protein
MNIFTFYESSSKLQEALRQVEKIDSITKDPSNYINQHFDECIDQINFRRGTGRRGRRGTRSYCNKLHVKNI